MTAAYLIRIAQTIMRRIAPGLAVLLALIATPSLAQSGLSGTYVSASPRSAEMIALVQTPDGRLVGRLESSSLQETGAVETSSARLEGAADGSNIVLNGFSGVIDGDVLDLSWQGGHRVFRRGTAEQFRAAVAVLETRSNQIEAQTTFATAIGNLTRLTSVLDGIEGGTPALHDQLASASERYRHLFPRFYDRRRARVAVNHLQSRGYATTQVPPDEQGYHSEIDAVNAEIIRFRSDLHRQFESARLLAASIDTYCADASDGAQTPPCAGARVQRARLERLSSVVQAEFDATAAAYREASVDVSPGRRLIESMVRR